MQETKYLSTDPNAGVPLPPTRGYLSLDPNAGDPIQQEAVSAGSGKGLGEEAIAAFADFGRGLWNYANPLAIGSALAHPINTAKSLLAAQGNQWTEATKAMDAGNHGEAAEHLAAWLLPVLGPAVDASIQKIRTGRVSEGLGEVSALIFGPAAVKALGGAKVPGLGAPAMLADADAVQFGIERGIPVDAATASGNRFVKGVQHLADRTAGGSVVAEKATKAQAEALTRVGKELAAEAYGKRAVSPEGAGRAVVRAVEAQAKREQGLANAAYDQLRSLEAMPQHVKPVTTGQKIVDTGVVGADGRAITRVENTVETMGLAVDLRQSKRALRGLHDQLLRQYPVTQQQASPGLKALQNVIEGPDFAPLSQVDADLSAIKTIARSDNPAFKTPGQATAMAALQQLEHAVERTAAAAGPDVQAALKAGRQATINKYASLGVLDELKAEPVKAFRQAIENRDAGIGRLRRVQRETPDAMPLIGRAYLEDLLDIATNEGGFAKGGTIASRWGQLGPQTKRTLFGTSLASDLDKFFLLAKRLGENPNPSGTAHVASIGAQGALLWTEPVSGVALQLTGYGLSRLMHSPRGVRALIRGLSIPESNRAAAIAATVELTNAARDAGVPMKALGVAESQPMSTRVR